MKFLIPRFRLTLQLLLDLKPEMICVVADTIAQKDERLAKQFAEKLPGPKRSDELEKELEESRARNEELTEKAVDAESLNASLEVQIEELKTRLAAARAAPPVAEKPNPHQERLPVDLESEVRTSQPTLSARRIKGDVVESASFTHEAYEAHFTPDLTRVLVRPSRSGASCLNGRVHVTGIARVDTTPAPRSYRLSWDERLSGFIIYLDQAAPTKEVG